MIKKCKNNNSRDFFYILMFCLMKTSSIHNEIYGIFISKLDFIKLYNCKDSISLKLYD